MRENYTLKRLYIAEPLSQGATLSLPKAQSHYVGTVLRMGEGDELRLFNGRDGEWRARITSVSKRSTTLTLLECLRQPKTMVDIVLAFAPVRRHRTAFIIEKATELGVARFEPVLTTRTQFPKLNLEKARAQVIEAAEQTERLDIPDIAAPIALMDWVSQQNQRQIIFADEAGDARPAYEALQSLAAPATLLIGPEGGFTPQERDALRVIKTIKPVSLGPRILRADTAALSLLTLFQALNGDWNETL
jgi:16S rRNA (uracil1498-N3)-methyltransferase